MTPDQQLHLILYVVLAVVAVELGIILWLVSRERRRRSCLSGDEQLAFLSPGGYLTNEQLPAAVRDDPDLGPIWSVRMSIGDLPAEEVGVISAGGDSDPADDLAHLMRALAVEFETAATEHAESAAGA